MTDPDPNMGPGADGVAPTLRQPKERIWYRKPVLLGSVALAITVVLNILFA